MSRDGRAETVEYRVGPNFVKSSICSEPKTFSVVCGMPRLNRKYERGRKGGQAIGSAGGQACDRAGGGGESER